MSDLLNYVLAHEDAFRKNRLPSLYSDFSIQKRTNPDGYSVNVAAWEHALTNAARHGQISRHAAIKTAGAKPKAEEGDAYGTTDHLVLRADDNLLRDLESPEWGKPVALGSVFDEALRKRTMIPLQVYKSNASSLNKSSWRVIDPNSFSPWNAMGWGLSQLKGILIGPENASSSLRLKVQELVLVNNLEEAGTRVISRATTKSSSRFDLIYSKEKFMSDFASIPDDGSELSDLDFDILLLYLSRDCRAIAYDGKTIKFRSAEDPTDITEQDTAIASLRTLISTLNLQMNCLELKIAELNDSAKTAISNKQRVSALSALRSKKMAESSLQKRSDTLAQLEQIYHKIEHAADQVEVLHAMEASTGVLRGINAKVGPIERVEDVMEGLRSEMDKTDEISTEIGSVIDEDEVDEELEAMEKEELQTKQDKESEATRRQLAELDRLEQAAKAATQEADSKNADGQAALSESITKMSRMSLENPPQEEERKPLKAE